MQRCDGEQIRTHAGAPGLQHGASARSGPGPPGRTGDIITRLFRRLKFPRRQCPRPKFQLESGPVLQARLVGQQPTAHARQGCPDALHGAPHGGHGRSIIVAARLPRIGIVHPLSDMHSFDMTAPTPLHAAGVGPVPPPAAGGSPCRTRHGYFWCLGVCCTRDPLSGLSPGLHADILWFCPGASTPPAAHPVSLHDTTRPMRRQALTWHFDLATSRRVRLFTSDYETDGIMRTEHVV